MYNLPKWRSIPRKIWYAELNIRKLLKEKSYQDKDGNVKKR